MKPELNSLNLLSITKSKAKMYEYSVPTRFHIDIPKDPSTLFNLSIGILGDLAYSINTSEEIDNEFIEEAKQNLLFSANFFESFLNSKLETEIDSYLVLMSSAAYYLSNMPGSSLVLIKKIKSEINLNIGGLDNYLVWLLKGDFSNPLFLPGVKYEIYLNAVSASLSYFFNNGTNEDSLFNILKILREEIYKEGTSRELLFVDIICAVVKLRYFNSTWYSLPIYSGLSVNLWSNTIIKTGFLRELWPSQHLLGKKGVFKGSSAVVQMPTSAGKTKAIELIIRSAYLAERANLVLIVAPFRALCHEIRNTLYNSFIDEDVSIDELSDVFQTDFELSNFLDKKQILVVTPEKLLYVLRFDSRLADFAGLVIYDEGHQFDNGSRGISYELLLTSLKLFIPKKTQTILISAVIRNAKDVNDWLNGENSQIVFGTTLLPTNKSVAFASWSTRLGKLQFVNPKNPDNEEFFVPRILKEFDLEFRGKEKNVQTFPNKNESKSIALFLGLQLVKNGSVALFCGRKDFIPGFCKSVLNAFERGLSLDLPLKFSNEDEVEKLSFLHKQNLGENSLASQCASLGIFTHHGNTPNGIRLSVEYALQKGLIKYVICTSTLAQGVNLPIRYLIISEVSQGLKPISVRDFHNLIGRAGRSGMHTEGNIIFSNPKIFDSKNSFYDKWRWKQVKDLLEIEKSEPCSSTLISILEPLTAKIKKREISFPIEDIIDLYLNDYKKLLSIPYDQANLEKGKSLNSELLDGINFKLDIINSIESYLMFYWNNDQIEAQDQILEDLITNTLAFHLANEAQRELLQEIFYSIHNNIQIKVPDNLKRKVFGRTLKGVNDSLFIETWIKLNLESLKNTIDLEELFVLIWGLGYQVIRNKAFRIVSNELLEKIGKCWINGNSFAKIFEDFNLKKIKFGKNYFLIDNVVDVCVNGFGFDLSLLLGSIIEVLKYTVEDDISEMIERLNHLQKRVKYGLPSTGSIIFYELGFSDRVIALELEKEYQENGSILKGKTDAYFSLYLEKEKYQSILESYPSYFLTVLDEASSRFVNGSVN